MLNHAITRMSYDELSKIIAKEVENDNLRFIATVITPWHAIGFEGWYIESGLPALNSGKGFVLITPHSLTGLALRPDHFLKSVQDQNIVFVEIDRLTKSLLLKSKDAILGVWRSQVFKKTNRREPQNSIQIISPHKANYALLPVLLDSSTINKVLPKFIVVDEGIGSYMTESVWNRKNEHLQKRGLFFAFKRSVGNILSRTTNDAFKQCECESRLLFTRSSNGSLLLDERMGNIYRHLIMEGAKRISIKESLISGERIALMLTQPFSESNQISLSQEQGLIVSKINDLFEKGFGRILIKPHPRESMAKFNAIDRNYPHEKVKILPREFPSEEIVSFLDRSTDIVVGCTSTALITSAALFGVKSYTFGAELDSMISNEDSLFHFSFSEFGTLSSRYVRSYSEL